MEKENQYLEFKQDRTKTYLKTVSAFSNYNGGEIRFGVKDDGSILPIDDPHSFALDLENQINDSITPQVLYKIVLNANNTISLIVEKGINPPYFYNGKSYKRNNTSTIEVDEYELRRLVLEGKNLSFDELDQMSFDTVEDDNIQVAEALEANQEELSHDELVEQVAKDIDDVFYTKAEEIPSIDEVSTTDGDILTEGDLDFIDELPQIEEESLDSTPTEEIPEIVEEEHELPVVESEPYTVDDINSLDTIATSEPETFEDPVTEDEIVESPEELPVYPAEDVTSQDAPAFEQGDMVSHPKYGKGVIEKLIKYGNKTLCSISFENVGRRLLDPAMSELEKV